MLSLCISVACPDSSVHQFLKRTCTHLKHLISSCDFTISWNLLNLLSDNFFYKNNFTHESFARHSLGFMGRGKVLQVAYDVFKAAGLFLSILCKTPIHLAPFRFGVKLRPIDTLYIADWVKQKQIGTSIKDKRENEATQLLISALRNTENIQKGAQIFKEIILSEKNAFHPIPRFSYPNQRSYEQSYYVLSRIILCYAWGNECKTDIPSIFKETTRLSIEEIRKKRFSSIEERIVILYQLKSLIIKQLQKDSTSYIVNPNVHHCLNQLKVVVEEELPNSLFLTYCWPQALLISE